LTFTWLPLSAAVRFTGLAGLQAVAMKSTIARMLVNRILRDIFSLLFNLLIIAMTMG
jgi:hypothetical protein